MSRYGKILVAGAAALFFLAGPLVVPAHARDIAPSVQALFDGHHGQHAKSNAPASPKESRKTARRHGRAHYSKLPHKRHR